MKCFTEKDSKTQRLLLKNENIDIVITTPNRFIDIMKKEGIIEKGNISSYEYLREFVYFIS